MSKTESYKWAAKRIRAQVLRHLDVTATLANAAAILKESFPHFFWVGFYHVRSDCLLLGPFQGPPACVKLALDRGVCATAARTRQIVRVPNVHEFPGHVACDARANSEIVLPVFAQDGSLRAVLDVDSQDLNAFDDEDAAGLQVVAELLKNIWNR
ncbi:GAF domain-containing protein [candidate division KSB1 bacterium]|nr:GAF domain-containing protein [candidate division KSB1 bacterium]